MCKKVEQLHFKLLAFLAKNTTISFMINKVKMKCPNGSLESNRHLINARYFQSVTPIYNGL